MANTNVLGVVSLHRLRNGSTVQFYLTSDKGLYQNMSGSTPTPDWTQATNRPTITPSVTGLNGGTITGYTWKRDGVGISSDGVNYSINSYGALTFLKSPVDTNNIRNIQYTCTCNIAYSNGATDSVTKSIVVLVYKGGENSYWGNINAPQGTILGGSATNDSADVESVTLTPTLWLGASKLNFSNSDFTVQWYKAGAGSDGSDLLISGQSVAGCNIVSDGCSLQVTREGVDGSAQFICRFLINGIEVEAEGVQVVDNKDEYFIVVSGDTNVYPGGSITLTPSVRKRSNNSIVSCTDWDVIVTDSIRLNKYPSSTYNITPTSGKFIMGEGSMYVPNSGSDKSSKPWLSVGDSSEQDVSVQTTSEATECDVVVQFIATV